MKALLVVTLCLALGGLFGMQVLVVRELLRFIKHQSAINRAQAAINAELVRLVELRGAERCE